MNDREEKVKKVAIAICKKVNYSLDPYELVCSGLPQMFSKGYVPSKDTFHLWTFYINEAEAAIDSLKE